MTTILIGISVGLGALVVLLLALLVVRWRSDNSTDERVAEVVASLNARMDELGRELAGALERAEEEGRRSRIFGELAGLDRPRRGAVADARGGRRARGRRRRARLLPDATDGKPLVATLGPVRRGGGAARDHRPAGRPTRRARSRCPTRYPELERERRATRAASTPASPCRFRARRRRSATSPSSRAAQAHDYADDDVRELEDARAARRPGDRERAALPRGAPARRPRRADRASTTGATSTRRSPASAPARTATSGRLALIVFDLDDFKAINDRIGHLAGDTVLAEAAERVRDVVRTRRHRLPRRRRRVRGDPARSRRSSDADQLYRRIQNAVSSRPLGQGGQALPLGRRRRASAPRTTRSRSSSAPTRRSTARRKPARAGSSRRTRLASAPPDTRSARETAGSS